MVSAKKTTPYRVRKSGSLLVEKVPLSGWIYWLYKEAFLPRLFRRLLCQFPQASKWMALYQKSTLSKRSIKKFVRKQQIDLSPFQLKEVRSFNDFFIRELKEGFRPILGNEQRILSPGEGCVEIIRKPPYPAKSSLLSLEALLENERLANEYRGSFAYVQRLAPKDYHRIHSPIASKVLNIFSCGKGYYSVHPFATKGNFSLIYQNKRKLIECSDFLLCLVGATFVGTIHLNVAPGQHIARGEELGYFSFGGSMVLLFFKEGHARFDEDLFDSSYPHFVEVREQIGHWVGS